MDNTLASILGTAGLPEELITSLQEAFDKKVAEAREEAEMSVREEFAARYEHDKANLVEAMDRMLTDVVKKVEESKAEEIKNLVEARAKYDNGLVEAKAFYKNKIREHMKVTQTFVTEQLYKSIKSLAEQKSDTIKTGKALKESYKALKAEMAKDHAARIKKIDEFVVRQVNRELNEFAQDKKALVETRVKLLSENKKKLKATQTRFVAEAAKKVDKAMTETLKREMTSLHEDLERNRQNMFGRRIFEAISAEFMTSYLAEGTEIRKLQNVLESKDKELAAAKAKITETAKAVDAIARKVKLAEDRAARTKIMSELLSPLRGEKRAVMESMLETTKTEALRSTFDKLLPVVLSEGSRKPQTQTEKKVLSENKAPFRRVVAVTGDKANRLLESAQTENEVEVEAEIGQIVRLAGIQK